MRPFSLFLLFIAFNFKLVVSQTPFKSPEASRESIYGLAVSPNGKFILAGGDDEMIYLWNKDAELIFSKKAHERSVNDVAFSPDGTQFLTAGSDQTFSI